MSNTELGVAQSRTSNSFALLLRELSPQGATVGFARRALDPLFGPTYT